MLRALQNRSIVDRFPACTVSHTELVDVLEYEGEKFCVGVDGGAVDGGAEVGGVALLEHGCLLELDLVLALVEGLQVEG